VFVLSSWFKAVLLANNLPAKKMVLLDKAVPTWTVGQKTESKHEKHEKETLRFVYLGRISEIKGLHVVLEALKDIDQARWSLDIYGQVEEKDYYLKCNRIIEDSRGIIDWKGIIDPKDVVDILQQYDALIFPTVIQEMVGLVVQEAFAAGIPVIGSNVMGIAEQITDDVDGLLFKAGNSEELNKLLKKVIASPSILSRLASNIKAPASFTNVAGQTLHHYQSVVDAKKLRPVN
jgi:glycosyltransferase involved in cell wall biosynthesis